MGYQSLACTNLLPTRASVQCNIEIETLHAFTIVFCGGHGRSAKLYGLVVPLTY